MHYNLGDFMKLVLLDASGFLFRTFYAVPPVARSDGAAVNAIKGYCEMLWWLIARDDYSHIAIVEDAGHSGREAIASNYKANRPPKPDELRQQFRMLPDASASFGIPTVKVPGCEADDVMASLAWQAVRDGFEVEIHSGDKDMWQLISPGISIYDPLKRQMVTPDVCRARFGVEPRQMICFQSLVGDSSDNVIGIPKVGAKTAAALLAAHGDLDTIIETVNERPEQLKATRSIAESILLHQGVARIARQLVTLKEVGPLPDIDDLRREQPDPTRLSSYLREMEFNRLAMDVSERLGMAA